MQQVRKTSAYPILNVHIDPAGGRCLLAHIVNERESIDADASVTRPNLVSTTSVNTALACSVVAGSRRTSLATTRNVEEPRGAYAGCP